MAGCGLPGFANFVGEATVFFGAWSQPALRVVTVLAVWGALVIGGVYMTRAIRTTLHGPLPARWNELRDATFWRRVPFVLLLASLFIFGCFPKLLTDKIQHDVKPLITLAAPARAGLMPVAFNSPPAHSN